MKSLAFYLPVTLLAAGIAHGQQNQAVDLIPALKKQCGIIKMVLERQRPDTEGSYKAAGTRRSSRGAGWIVRRGRRGPDRS